MTLRLHLDDCSVLRGAASGGDFGFTFAVVTASVTGSTGPATTNVVAVPDESLLPFVKKACPHTDLTFTDPNIQAG